MIGFVSGAVSSCRDPSATRRRSTCDQPARREFLSAAGKALLAIPLIGFAEPGLADEAMPLGREYYEIALDCKLKIAEISDLVKESKYDETRQLLRSDPLVNVRKACFYLANYSAEAGQRKQTVASYKKMIQSLEDLDHQALLVSRSQSTADVVKIAESFRSNYDDFLSRIPNQLK